MSGEIVNRIAQSPIVTFKIEEYYPRGERVQIDIADQLFRGMILREKDFREWVKTHDWSQYRDQYVAVDCSVDAIVQIWAYMLVAVKLRDIAAHVTMGTIEDLDRDLIRAELDKVDFSQYEGRPVVIKGCSEINIPAALYVEVTRRMLPFAKKLSYGEPCSTVPLYKRSQN